MLNISLLGCHNVAIQLVLFSHLKSCRLCNQWWWKSLPPAFADFPGTNLWHPRLCWDDSVRRQVSNSRRELWVPAASGAPLARPVTSRPRQRSRPRHRSSPTPPAIPSLLGYTILLQYAPVCYTILLQYRSRQSLGLQIFYACSGIDMKNDRDVLCQAQDSVPGVKEKVYLSMMCGT